MADAKQLNPPKTSPAAKTAASAGKPLAMRLGKKQHRQDVWRGVRNVAR